MALKRKRSSISFSSPSAISTASTTNDSPATAIPYYYYQQQKPAPPAYEKPTWAFPTYDDSSSAQHLNSRTRKRHRDLRPDEREVHASTISRLYDAQRKHPDAAPVMSSQSLGGQSGQERPQRSNLHAFWSLPSAPVKEDSTMLELGGDGRKDEAPRCEDCERPLRDDNAMDLDDGTIQQENACAVCRKHVCDLCSVLSGERVCLGCIPSR